MNTVYCVVYDKYFLLCRIWKWSLFFCKWISMNTLFRGSSRSLLTLASMSLDTISKVLFFRWLAWVITDYQFRLVSCPTRQFSLRAEKYSDVQIYLTNRPPAWDRWTLVSSQVGLRSTCSLDPQISHRRSQNAQTWWEIPPCRLASSSTLCN